jgi:hypothetical protein
MHMRFRIRRYVHRKKSRDIEKLFFMVHVGALLVMLVQLLAMNVTINVKSHEYDRWEKVMDLF